MKIYRYKYWLNFGPLLTDRGAILPNIAQNKILLIQVPPFIFFQTLKCFTISIKKKIDLIHAHWIIPQGITALIIKKTLHIPYVVTTHGGDIFGLDNVIFNYLKGIVLKNANGVTVVSHAIKNKILNDIDKNIKIDVVPMGVDTKKFSPEKKDEVIRKKYGLSGAFLLFVGRLSEKKGVDYLIRAMPNIVKKFPKTKLLIIGGGELEGKLKIITKDLGLTDSVVFLGPVYNKMLPRYYATADIFIGPSIVAKSGDREGLPVTYMEAMSSGCCVIASNLKGNRDLIRNGITGFIVKQKDPKDLSKKVISVLKEEDLSQKIGKNGRRFVIENFDWKVIANKYIKILSSF